MTVNAVSHTRAFAPASLDDDLDDMLDMLKNTRKKNP